MVRKRFLSGKGPLRKFFEERMRRGPILKKLREEFFRAASRVYDVDRFSVSLLDDINAAKGLVVIVSPFLNRDKVRKFINAREVKDALKREVSIVVVTRPPDPKEVRNIDEHKECIDMLKDAGIRVALASKLHFKSAVIDEEIIYLGSINPLSIITYKYVPPDYMVRFESEALVDEIIENAIGKDRYEEWVT